MPSVPAISLSVAAVWIFLKEIEMMFRRSTVGYGQTPEPETPYQRAGQVWDERIGSARVQARNWRLAFFCTLALSGSLAGGLIWQSMRGTITPWVVQVDALGEALAVAPAVASYQPTDAQIAWHIARFIQEVRSVPADPVVLRQNWMEAYNYVTDKGAAALSGYARLSDPFSKTGKSQVSVDVSNVIRASDSSFRVEWVERRYADGSLASTERWSAILTIVLQTPTDVDRLRQNPLGVYIHALNWSKELG
jgi:type IV secretory pathway TrbF-like protein